MPPTFTIYRYTDKQSNETMDEMMDEMMDTDDILNEISELVKSFSNRVDLKDKTKGI